MEATGLPKGDMAHICSPTERLEGCGPRTLGLPRRWHHRFSISLKDARCLPMANERTQSRMNTVIATQLSDSARDFANIVWPHIAAVPLINGGEIRPVEAVAEKHFKNELDFLSGIDAWQIQYAPTAMRGIASRVQWGPCHHSFSIRIRVASGQETEFQKRLRAIQHQDEGHIYPHLTIQAFLDERGGKLLAAAAVRTRDLIENAAILVDNRSKLGPSPERYGFISNPDGTEFLYMKWDYLLYKGVLDGANVITVAS